MSLRAPTLRRLAGTRLAPPTLAEPPRLPRPAGRTPARRACVYMLALAGALPLTASAQNLALNGGFDAGLAGWRATGEGTAAPSTEDIVGDPGSGSVRLGNAQPDAGTQVVPLDQCIPMLVPGTYEIGGSARVDPAQVPGRAVIGVALYDGLACDGALRAVAGRFIPRAATFTPVAFEFTAANGGSLLLRLGVDKPGAGGSLEVNIDAVSVVRTPLVFADGFE